MTALTKYFFNAVYTPSSAWSVVQWWESRRPVYNLAVGAAGLVSLGVMNLVSVLPPYPMPPVLPVIGVAVYGLLANGFYTLGPLADLVIRRRWGHQYAVLGPVMLRYGFAFAVGLTLLPVPMSLVWWVSRLVRLLFF